MSSLLKHAAALLAGGMTLYWQPGLETVQNLVTSTLGLMGPVVAFVWLLLSFAWAFMAALVGGSAAIVLLDRFHMAGSTGIAVAGPTTRPEAPQLPSSRLSASSLLPHIATPSLIAAVLTLAFLVLRQTGFDSREVRVIDPVTGEARSFRMVTVLPRDAISSITAPGFVPVSQAARWMRSDDRVIGVDIGGEQKAYPIGTLSRHEIVNDVVGGKPVAVTW